MVSGATVHLQSILSADETSPESIFVFGECIHVLLVVVMVSLR